MDSETMDAVRQVIEYLRDSGEGKDYLGRGKPEGHIWESVMVLEKYLDGE